MLLGHSPFADFLLIFFLYSVWLMFLLLFDKSIFLPGPICLMLCMFFYLYRHLFLKVREYFFIILLKIFSRLLSWILLFPLFLILFTLIFSSDLDFFDILYHENIWLMHLLPLLFENIAYVYNVFHQIYTPSLSFQFFPYIIHDFFNSCAFWFLS